MVDKDPNSQPRDPNLLPPPEGYVPPPPAISRRQAIGMLLAGGAGAGYAYKKLTEAGPVITEPYNINAEVSRARFDMPKPGLGNNQQSLYMNKDQEAMYAGLKEIIDDTHSHNQPQRIMEYLRKNPAERGDKKELGDFVKNVVSKALAYTMSMHVDTTDENRAQILEAIIAAMPLDPNRVRYFTGPGQELYHETKDIVQLARDGWVNDHNGFESPDHILISPNSALSQRLEQAIDARVKAQLQERGDRSRG